MGNNWARSQNDTSKDRSQNSVDGVQGPVSEIINDIGLNRLSDEKRQELMDFKFEMVRKHEKRREILAAKKKEFDDMREELTKLREENRKLKDGNLQQKFIQEIDVLRQKNELLASVHSGSIVEEIDFVLTENVTLKGELKAKVEDLDKATALIDKNRELQVSIANMQLELQNLNRAMLDFEKEREEYKAHAAALKDVISVSKKMLLIRESQLKELREKVESIEASVSEKEISILSKDLRMEYEKQLQILRNMRAVYEERQRTDHREKETLRRTIEETKRELEAEQRRNKESEERVAELENQNSQRYDEIKSLESNLGLAKAESRQYQAELAVINQLFSEILLGFNSSQEIDLDKLTKHLEDNHALLQNIASSEVSSDSSFALPKLLLDLVRQVHNEREMELEPNVEVHGCGLQTIAEESESQPSTDQINSVEEIIQTLPKVWRVLMELLSHHKVPVNDISEGSPNDDPCYKTVQTPKGPSLVLSVSQTYNRLKDLIMEKKSLKKETRHLKQLNTHLENRLQDQEKRLEMVSSELNKTWHVVGKLQKEHQHLHTQEKVLRYELAQKRKLLITLREQLEYSREKRQEAREKNSKTEKQWKQLRVEFASRRNTLLSDEFNNSPESGYSDEKCSSDDEPGYETDVSESGAKNNESNNMEEVEELMDEDMCSSNIPSNDVKCAEASSSEVSDSPTQQLPAPSLTSSLGGSPSHEVLDQESKNFSASSSFSNNEVQTSFEEKLALREERLKRLEGQCGELMEQVVNTNRKSVSISNKLDNLHEAYGENTERLPDTRTDENVDMPLSGDFRAE
ncbi:early endosome antigen 1 [Euwallacea fornicatus]|uniref:early endosome antigen 1 n=1 Tax=Euwallacea fornicatus TaxID=995702 RepID=UPI00338FB14A